MRLQVAVRSALFAAKLRLFGGLLCLAVAGACDLNPQPLPPGPELGARGSADAGSASTGSSGSSASSGVGSSSGSSSGSSFGSGSASAGAGPLLDSAAPDTHEAGGSADATTADAGSEASPSADAEVDGPPANDGGCVIQSDCHTSFPDTCNICASPLNYLTCVGGQCVCACQAKDASHE
jgi:hypothetical protein